MNPREGGACQGWWEWRQRDTPAEAAAVGRGASWGAARGAKAGMPGHFLRPVGGQSRFRRTAAVATSSETTRPPVTQQLKLNTDESPGVATEYGIRSIPTVMIFKNGQKLDTVIGAVPKSTLVSIIDKYL